MSYCAVLFEFFIWARLFKKRKKEHFPFNSSTIYLIMKEVPTAAAKGVLRQACKMRHSLVFAL